MLPCRLCHRRNIGMPRHASDTLRACLRRWLRRHAATLDALMRALRALRCRAICCLMLRLMSLLLIVFAYAYDTRRRCCHDARQRAYAYVYTCFAITRHDDDATPRRHADET